MLCGVKTPPPHPCCTSALNRMIDNDWDLTEPGADFRGSGSLLQIHCLMAFTTYVRTFIYIYLIFFPEYLFYKTKAAHGAWVTHEKQARRCNFTEIPNTSGTRNRREKQHRWVWLRWQLMTVNIFQNTQGLCLEMSKQLFVLETLGSIALPRWTSARVDSHLFPRFLPF